MVSPPAQRVWLERQADRLERALSALELPVRVNGAQVSDGRVRYHVTPMGYTRLEQVEKARGDVAAALGAPEVHVAREIGGMAIEVEAGGHDDVRLLPLMHAMGDPGPLTAVLGMSDQGRPLTLPLASDRNAHLWIEGGQGTGKSELLRAAALSLAMASRPAQLQLLGVDPSGRELAFLEALPHALAELASEARFANELLGWLAEEVGRRRRLEIARPALVLLVDGLELRERADEAPIIAALRAVAEGGGEVGVHSFLAARSLPRELKAAAAGRPDVVRAQAADEVGQFRFRAAGREVTAEVAWLPARDLATAVELASQRPGALTAADFKRPR